MNSPEGNSRVADRSNQQTLQQADADASQTMRRELAEAKHSLDSNPAVTAAKARAILAAHPGNPEARFLLGAALRRVGDARGATALLQPLKELQPRSRILHLELGLAVGADGDSAAAIATLSRAIELDPRYVEAWRALGEQKFLAGDRIGSEAAYAQAGILSAGDPRLEKAVAAMSEGRLEETEDVLVEMLDADPDDVRALKLLGEIALRGERFDDAEALFERCLELAPDFTEARASYATVLLASSRLRQAIVELETMLAHDPGNPDYGVLMGNALLSGGELEKSEAWHQQLVRAHPRHVAALVGYAHTLDALGKRELAIKTYRDVIAISPWFGAAYSSLANVRGFRFTESEIAEMESQLARSDLAQEDRIGFHFALGKVYEDRGDFAPSFENYAAGNAIRRSSIQYGPETTAEFVSCSVEMLTPKFFHDRSGSGCNRPDPIFIVGLPRSGSTLIEQMLASHSAIEALGELCELPRLVRQLHYDYSNVEYPEVLGLLGSDEFKRLGEEYLRTTQPYRKLDRPFFTDKAPSNFADIGLIQLILPAAKIIDVRRHPLACSFSNFRQNFARGQVFSYSLDDFSRFYREYVRLMAHFDSVLPGKIHRIFYEDIIADPERAIRRLLEFLGLPFEEECLRFYENRRYARTASSDQVRVPIFTGAVDHWRNYEPWLGRVKQELGAVLDAYPEVPDF